jgi:hypothetical protein
MVGIGGTADMNTRGVSANSVEDDPHATLTACTGRAVESQMRRGLEFDLCTLGGSVRVVVLSPRPGRVVEDVRINLPRPRNLREARSSRQFNEYVIRLGEFMGMCDRPSNRNRDFPLFAEDLRIKYRYALKGGENK